MAIPRTKIFKDSVHGPISLNEKLVKIIDTPEFQRLRHIKQMWSTYRVYPGASHNRFEHSIGVCHLAGLLVRSLQKNEGESLNLNEKDILCVEIAGLCHDLGHGPFSHVFDDCFLPIVLPKEMVWKHEDGSILMLDHLLTNNKIGEQTLKDYLELKDKDVDFVKDLITGKPANGTQDDERYKANGKKFLFEIVSNKLNGFDVDRFDYFARDSHHLGLTNSFDYMRFILFARVLNCEGGRHICIRDKEAFNMQKLYITRYSLYYTASQHPKVTAVELMVTDALTKANEYLQITSRRYAEGQSRNGSQDNEERRSLRKSTQKQRRCTKMSEKVPRKRSKLSDAEDRIYMSTAIHDPKYYTTLTDDVYEQILKSDNEELQDSQKILNSLEKRELYVFVGQTQPLSVGRLQTIGNASSEDDHTAAAATPPQCASTTGTVTNKVDHTWQVGLEESLARQILKRCQQLQNSPAFERKSIRVKVLRIGCGASKSTESDNVSFHNMWFYSKGKPTEARMIDSNLISYVLMPRTEEEYLRVYSTLPKDSNETKTIAAAFKAWCKTFGLSSMIW